MLAHSALQQRRAAVRRVNEGRTSARGRKGAAR